MKKTIKADAPKPPKDAAEKIVAWASAGTPRKDMARRFGVGKETFRKWIETYPELQDALDEGIEADHEFYRSKLRDQAAKGNIAAIIFALKTRHGYRENETLEARNNINVTFQLPAPMTVEQYRGNVIEHQPEPKALPAKGGKSTASKTATVRIEKK